MLVDGERRWTWYEDVDTDADDFPRLGTDFVEQSEAADLCRGRVACASAELMSQRAVVDFAVEWLPRQRTC
jgi:aminoglycoside 3-N-acetyltransferase